MATAEKKPSRYGERLKAGRRPASMEFDEDVYLRLQAQGLVEERSMAALIRVAVDEYLDRKEGRCRCCGAKTQGGETKESDE